MAVEAASILVDRIFFAKTGKHLNDLENLIIKGVWQGKKYLDIAEEYCCTEGHVKDIAANLWQVLSLELGEKIIKTNFRSAIERQLKLTASSANYLEFIGREKAIESLNNKVKQGSKIILIQGKGGIGKTTLARAYLQQGNFEIILEVLMAKASEYITSLETLVAEWLARDFGEEPARELGINLSRLKRHLIAAKVGILIDNLEPVLDRNGQLIKAARNYLELLAILSDRSVNSVTIITSRDRLGESAISVDRYCLSGLECSVWQQYFSFYNCQIKDYIIREIHKIYGGNAKAMGIVCGTVKEDFHGDLAAYWQENQDDPLVEIELKNLVVSQFDRLEKLDPIAYKILCRLGGYRDRDIATFSKEIILALFGDIKVNKYSQIIQSLRNRSLIEYGPNKYWLHPIIKAEAKARLLANKELEKVCRCLAEFWTKKIVKITNLRDAIAAWQAFYYYLEIADFELASRVILKSRINQWGQYLPLGSTLYRMGLSQTVLAGIGEIINKVKSDYSRGELNNILGDLYWINGEISAAIAAQEKTINIANNCLANLEKSSQNERNLYYLKMLQIDSLLSIGSYKIDLWELAAAAELFKKVISLANNTPHYRWAEKANLCLALVNSYLNISDRYIEFTNKIYQQIIENKKEEYRGRFAYFIQILAQTYANLGEKTKAIKMCDNAIAFAAASNYTQVKAKTLTTLAELKRQAKNYNLAINYHQESIQILEEIGAKCDLANAYLQYSLTLNQSKDLKESQEYLQRSLAIYLKINAPKQIEKLGKLRF